MNNHINKRILGVFLCALLFALLFVPLASGESVSVAYAENGKYVYLGGNPIGISVTAGGLIVLDIGEVVTAEGGVTPLKGVGISRGDVIVEVNNQQISSIYQLKTMIEDTPDSVILTVRKANGARIIVSVKPALDMLTDTLKLGLLAKEDIGGIGTLSFITEEGRFGALGHRIADPESGLYKTLTSGNIYPAVVTGVVKGENGRAGGLTAQLNRLQTPIGNVEKNTDIGIFGDYTAEPVGEKFRIAEKGEAKMGRAQILTTVSGSSPKLYDVNIVKVVSQEKVSEKGLVLDVRDKELLSVSNGIVQGMSGSPIIQNGLLIGAVTHVFLSDSTRGYGVHSRFMYEYASVA